jgi:hypothetical protein
MSRLWTKKWNKDKDSVIQSARKFKQLSEWKKKFPSARVAARRLNIYKLATKHMIDGRFKQLRSMYDPEKSKNKLAS